MFSGKSTANIYKVSKSRGKNLITTGVIILYFLYIFGAPFHFEGFTSIPTALTANDRNRRIQSKAEL